MRGYRGDYRRVAQRPCDAKDVRFIVRARSDDDAFDHGALVQRVLS